MPLLADDNVVVHGNAERLGDLHHGEARALPDSTFRVPAIIKSFAVLSALHPAADMNAVSRHVC